MNAPVDLDTRLRAAGDALHRAVEPLPAGEPPERSSGSGVSIRRSLLAAAAVILVVAAGVGAVVALRGGNDDQVSNDPDVVPFLIFNSPPDSMPITGGVDLPVEQGGESGATVSLALYDVAGKDLAVLTSEDPNTQDPAEPEQPDEPVTVRGKTGGYEDSSALGLSLRWREAPGVVVAFYSRTLDREQLLAAATAATGLPPRLVPGPVVAGGAAPTMVGGIDALTSSLLVPLPERALGHVVGYQGDETNRVASVMTITASPDDVRALRWWADATTPAEVRGHDGWVGSQTFENLVSGGADGTTRRSTTTWTVVWEEQPGVYGIVEMSEVGKDELLALVDDIRPATRAERSEIAAATLRSSESEGNSSGSSSEESVVSEAPPGETGPMHTIPEGGRGIIGGTFSDGSWLLYNDADGSLCAEVTTSTSGGSCNTAPDSDGAAVALAVSEGATLVYGAGPGGTNHISPVGGSVNMGDGKVYGRYFAFPVEAGQALPTSITFYADDNRVLGTVDLGGG